MPQQPNNNLYDYAKYLWDIAVQNNVYDFSSANDPTGRKFADKFGDSKSVEQVVETLQDDIRNAGPISFKGQWSYFFGL